MQKNKNETCVTVRLPRISGNNDAVYVSVGERSWRIKRGCDVSIPLCAYDVLRNSEIAEDKAVSFMERIR